MSKAFREYLELYEYFGRGGLPKLDPDQFESARAELEELVARAGKLAPPEVDRALGLRDLLLRDRPKRSQLERRK